jgi:RNA polymerase sigma-70 factor (ECF subfamily)
VNGQPGALILTADGAVVSVWALDLADDRITAVRAIVNPDKLRHVPGAADLGEWLRRGTRPTG